MVEQNELVFLPLGGAGEIGMNMNLFGIGPASARQWLMIDCGVTFGDADVPGIDLVTPDPEYILDELAGSGELLGLVLTHGHEDHIGAVPILWPRLQCPIYTTSFTGALLGRKFQEAKIINPPVTTLAPGQRFTLGPFDLELVTLTHSIPEPNGVVLRTQFGTILHTGDWKIDRSPTLGPLTDTNKLSKLGDDGVLAMVCDSTNVLSPGESGSESDVRSNLIELIAAQKGRVAVTTFASNVGRLASICTAAQQSGRSICLLGRSMIRMVDVAMATGVLPPDMNFVQPKDVRNLPAANTLYLCTGSQGESRAALSRIARGDHRDLSLGDGDTVIFSSKIIPGNERGIFDLQNRLVDMGVRIVTEKDAFIHVSGHPCRDELQQMYDWVRPEVAIPVHGEARHLEEHAILARSLGVKRAIAPRNGSMIRIAPGAVDIIDEVPSGRLMRDGHILLPQGSGVLRARRCLSEEGHITVVIVLDDDNMLLAPPDIVMAGVPPLDRFSNDLQEVLEDTAEDAVDALPRARRHKDSEVEKHVRQALRKTLLSRWGKRSDIAVLTVRI